MLRLYDYGESGYAYVAAPDGVVLELTQYGRS
jgi:hypothetical protein